MELTLTTFFGLSEEHAARIMALDETSRNKKIEEYRRRLDGIHRNGI